MKREPTSLKSSGKLSSNATFRKHEFPHRRREMQALSRAEEKQVSMLQT
jgi:uncharacterized protein YozE (UPF0346 family)